MIYRVFLVSLISYLLFSCTRNVETVKEYYSDGTLMESYQTIESDVRVGEYIFNYSNGQPRARGQFEDGLMSGVWAFYYENGKLQSTQKFARGELIQIDTWDSTGLPEVVNGTGRAKLFYSNGQIKSSVSYLNNLRHGESKTWYENGQQESLQHFERGEPSGIWYFWNEEGEVIKQNDYGN